MRNQKRHRMTAKRWESKGEYVGKTQETPHCESCNKDCYSSKRSAREALMGQLSAKSIRVYECPHNHGKWHITKDWKTKRNR